jgi:hypothetical protein
VVLGRQRAAPVVAVDPGPVRGELGGLAAGPLHLRPGVRGGGLELRGDVLAGRLVAERSLLEHRHRDGLHVRAPEDRHRARVRQAPDMADLDADPMRDLDWSLLTGQPMEPLFFAWTTFCPRHMTRRRLLAARQTFMRRAHAAGVTCGPDGEPVGDDELSRRRARRR